MKPKSKAQEVSQEEDSFVVKVNEPPRDGRANQAVLKSLAENLGVSQSQDRILSGLNSRNRTVEIAGEVAALTIAGTHDTLVHRTSVYKVNYEQAYPETPADSPTHPRLH